LGILAVVEAVSLVATAIVPSAASSGRNRTAGTNFCDSWVVDGSTTGVAGDEPEAEESAGKPEDGREERESDVSLPFLTCAFLGDVAPVENVATVERSDEVDEETKGNHPGGEEDEVHDIVEVRAAEWDEPDQSEQDRESGNDFGVDESSLVVSGDIAD